MNLLFALLFPSHISILVLYEKWHTILYLKVLHFPYIIVRHFLYSNFPRKNFSVSYTFILLLNDTNFYYKNQRRQFSNGYLEAFDLAQRNPSDFANNLYACKISSSDTISISP